MDVSCPACAARYTADDDKLRGKTARMRCKACDTVWLVSGPEASVVSDLPPLSGSPSSLPPSPPSSGKPKTAAVVKRGADREKRDLFAKQEHFDGGVSATIPPPSSVVSAGVGARSEDSVLFRVDQLARAARLKTPLPNQPVERATDEEGVIDLKALTSVNVPVALRPVGLPVAPLFTEPPPPVTLDVDAQSPNARRPNKNRLIGGCVAAAVMLAALGWGVSIAFKSEEPVKRDAVVAMTPPPSPPPTPVSAPAPTVDPTPAPAVPEATLPKAKKGKHRKGRGTNAPAAVSKAGAEPAKTTKPADPCGCHGDFNCVLACTAKNGS